MGSSDSEVVGCLSKLKSRPYYIIQHWTSINKPNPNHFSLLPPRTTPSTTPGPVSFFSGQHRAGIPHGLSPRRLAPPPAARQSAIRRRRRRRPRQCPKANRPAKDATARAPAACGYAPGSRSALALQPPAGRSKVPSCYFLSPAVRNVLPRRDVWCWRGAVVDA